MFNNTSFQDFVSGFICWEKGRGMSLCMTLIYMPNVHLNSESFIAGLGCGCFMLRKPNFVI